MDNPTVFAVLCLIGGSVVAVTLPWRLREPLGDAGVLGRVLMILILLSFMTFLWSLGGTGIALALVRYRFYIHKATGDILSAIPLTSGVA